MDSVSFSIVPSNSSTMSFVPNWSCLFAAGSPTDTVGSQNFLYSSNTTSWRLMRRANNNSIMSFDQGLYLITPNLNYCQNPAHSRFLVWAGVPWFHLLWYDQVCWRLHLVDTSPLVFNGGTTGICSRELILCLLAIIKVSLNDSSVGRNAIGQRLVIASCVVGWVRGHAYFIDKELPSPRHMDDDFLILQCSVIRKVCAVYWMPWRIYVINPPPQWWIVQLPYRPWLLLSYPSISRIGSSLRSFLGITATSILLFYRTFEVRKLAFH